MSDQYYPEPPDYRHFARLPDWSIDEAINLLAMAQIRDKQFSDSNLFNEALRNEYWKIHTVIFCPDECGYCAWQGNTGLFR
jgi:hypothetical protein